MERDIGASGNEFSLMSTFGFLGLPYEFRIYAHVERGLVVALGTPPSPLASSPRKH